MSSYTFIYIQLCSYVFTCCQSLHSVFISACVHEVAVFAFSFDASNVACCQVCFPEES